MMAAGRSTGRTSQNVRLSLADDDRVRNAERRIARQTKG